MQVADSGRQAGPVGEVFDGRALHRSGPRITASANAMQGLIDPGDTGPAPAWQTLELLTQQSVFVYKSATPLLIEEAASGVSRLTDLPLDQDARSPEAPAGTLKAFAKSGGVALGRIGPPPRGLLNGTAPSPDMGVTLGVPGKLESPGRIEDALSPAK
ncbi:hypothetical protein [Caulobacter sp. NIBR1757]|uniref:hypothetical protein n=1 Tax=Caulobacter sp. NIBR1757 TaxID=3016000 RepID=UPI0022F04CAD|nr:hypothetical protein [Caulobacter sp. NIBR1757]WGM38787.1 hypothetical protein AMEJIAPC_01692 [Caulobacter sp. NIBR1757]